MSDQFPIIWVSNSCPAQADDVFGPIVNGCRNDLDFTLLFEQSIFSILPSALFLLLAPLRVLYLYKQELKVFPNPFQSIKLAVAATLAALQLILLVLWSINSARTRASIPAAALAFVVGLEIIPLSFFEHNRSIQPSSALNIYLLFAVLCDIPQARTLYLQDGKLSLAVVFSVTMGIKLALLILEALEKRSYLRLDYLPLSPESTSGIFNRSFLWWLNGLFMKGSRKVITLQDLYGLDPALAAASLGAQLQETWDRRGKLSPKAAMFILLTATAKPEGRFAFAFAVFKSLYGPVLYTFLPRLSLIGFEYAQPFLIHRTLDLLYEEQTAKSRMIGYGLIAATGFIFLGIAISNLHYQHNLYRFITMFRGATVSLIYERTLRLQDGAYDEAASITLMSTDVDTIAVSLENVIECGARLLEVLIGVFLLARELGWVSIMPLAVVLVSSGGTSIITRFIGGRQKVWADAVQHRIAITSSMLAEMKSVKMMGLSRIFTNIVQEQRVMETGLLAAFNWIVVWLNVVSNLPWAIAPAATFAVYAIQAVINGSDALNTTQAFTSLAIIILVTNRAAQLLSSIPRTAASIGSFDRIQNFLLATSREDGRCALEPGIYSNTVDRSSQSQTEDADEQPQANGLGHDGNDTAVHIKNADIRPSNDADIALHHINLSIDRGSLVMVIGPVAAGKTTLVRAILGEIGCDHGSVSVMNKNMAYCAQNAWLPNCSIRQAICGPTIDSNHDEEWYTTVVRACVLNHDLSDLKDGDRTVIGSRGVILSGGQKQRIALARAVYARYQILILDDVLSALDKRTESTVMDRVFGRDGLLQSLGSTVVLVTHAIQHLHLASKVIILSDKGHITHQGTYDEVKGSGFAGITAKSEAESAEDQDGEKTVSSKAKSLREESNEEIENLLRQTGDVDVYKYYFSAIGSTKMFFFVFFVVVNVFCSSFSQVWLKWWTDIGGGQVPLYISIYFLLAIFNSIGMGCYIWVMCIRISPSTGRKFHYILLQTVMRAPQRFFNETEIGSILSRFSQDMTLIEGQLSTAVLITITNLLSLIAEVALISIGSTYMALTIPVLAIVIYVLQHIYLRTSRQLRLLDIESRSPVYSHFLETLEGLATIRAFAWENESRDTNLDRLDTSQEPYYLLFCIQQWLALVLDLIMGAMAIIVVTLAVSLRGSTNPGLLGVSMNNVLTFNLSLSSFVTGWTMLETSLGAIARLRNFEASTPVEAQKEEVMEPPVDWPSLGAIKIQGLIASHKPSAIALRNISMDIQSGEKIGVCGRTGSGKSSLIATILRMLEIDSGSITIDGYDIATLPRETIRERLITMPQDTLHFIGSARQNADPFGTNNDKRIMDVLTKVRLWDTIQERGGLDAEIDIQSLSKGQQQLFSLGRAMLQKGTIVLLDEATSSVDKDTDQIMQQVIKDEFRHHTIITVAHRLETIMDADRIAVMDSGHLIEFDSPKELLSRDSAFRRLQRS